MKIVFTFLLAAVMGTAQSTQDPRMYPLQICDGSHCDVYPVRPELHSAMVEVGHCYRVTVVETLQEIACPAESSGTLTWKPLENAPFDVPPKEWDEAPIKDRMECRQVGIAESTCDYPKPVHHRTCEDKRRFLLMSEDSKWHCLLLAGDH